MCNAFQCTATQQLRRKSVKWLQQKRRKSGVEGEEGKEGRGKGAALPGARWLCIEIVTGWQSSETVHRFVLQMKRSCRTC